jgi:hypothetical protein
MAHSGHPWLHRTCPLLGVKRTSTASAAAMRVLVFGSDKSKLSEATERYLAYKQGHGGNVPD